MNIVDISYLMALFGRWRAEKVEPTKKATYTQI